MLFSLFIGCIKEMAPKLLTTMSKIVEPSAKKYFCGLVGQEAPVAREFTMVYWKKYFLTFPRLPV